MWTTGLVRFLVFIFQENEAVAPIFEQWIEPLKDLGVTTITMRDTDGTDHESFDAVGIPAFNSSRMNWITVRVHTKVIWIHMKLRLAFAVTAFTAAAPYLSAQDRSYGRSVVVTKNGIVATSYVQASQAGARFLEQGGSAIDAGIAANAVLGVAEPMMNGMGGDLFAIYWDAKTGKLYGLNASGWAPKAFAIEHLKAKGVTEMPQSGIDSVTVPGVVDGWTKLHDRFGKLPWRDLFQPAIFYADHGYPVPEMIHDYWKVSAPGLMQNPGKPARLSPRREQIPETARFSAIPTLPKP